MVGGKTGTAEKIQAGSIKKPTLPHLWLHPGTGLATSFIILVDEPKGQKHSGGYSTAGWVVAPAVRRIVEQIAPILEFFLLTKNRFNSPKNAVILRLVTRRQRCILLIFAMT